MSDTSQSLPPAALIVQFPVADFDTWKAGFDNNEDQRVAAGILGHHINQAEDDPNSLSVYLAVADIDKARAFAGSDELKEVMKEVGVLGPPTTSWMTPVELSVNCGPE